MKSKIIACIIMILFSVGLASAIQPTQQFNKIYLNPYYRDMVSGGTWYSYDVSINPPDGISMINSAILSFNAQINGVSQNFSILVNGEQCNTPSYYISTAYSSSGNIQFSFDCSKS